MDATVPAFTAPPSISSTGFPDATMINRSIALIFTVFAAAVGGGLALLAIDEIPTQTREVEACVYNVHRYSKRVGYTRSPLKYTYMVIETDRNLGKFVQYIGKYSGNADLLEKIHPGDCVTITVDEAALKGQAKSEPWELMVAKRVLKWVVQGWPIIPSDGQPWIRIQSLERGGKELISPFDALLWPLGVLSGLSLLFLAFALRQLGKVAFGGPID